MNTIPNDLFFARLDHSRYTVIPNDSVYFLNYFALFKCRYVAELNQYCLRHQQINIIVWQIEKVIEVKK